MPDDRKIRILIIDDDVGFRDLLRIHLSSAGYEMQVAEDGVTGGRALLAQAPDLIVSDVNMPFLDGFELLSLLRADASTASIPVILLSGRSDGDTMARAVELGAADFLTKPVTRDQLLESVEACLARAKKKVRTTAPNYGSTPPV
jgi:DNA-binding response OmpR family regulator